MKPTEVEWLGAYESWADGTEASLAAGLAVSRAACESTFDDEVGEPPSERLEPWRLPAVAAAPRRLRRAGESAQANVVRALMADARRASAAARAT